MLDSKRIQTTKDNKQMVISSAIVAKAAVRLENGRIHILVAFQKSTRLEFYWAYQASNARTPRRAWKQTCTYGRDSGMASFKPYSDFGSFVRHYAQIKHAEVLSVRVLHSRRMAALLTKTDHDTIQADWTPQDINAEIRVTRQNKRFRAKMRGALPWS